MKKVDVEIDIEDSLLFALMLEAHKQDITLNNLVNKLLRKYIEKVERDERKHGKVPG